MKDLRFPSSTKQFAYAEVVTTADNPTSKPVSVAVMPRGVEPEAGDFKTAEWITGPLRSAVMVGPGSDVGELVPGVYKLWTKVTATPEVPVLESTNCLVIT